MEMLRANKGGVGNIRALRETEIRDPQYAPLSSHGSEVPVG